MFLPFDARCHIEQILNRDRFFSLIQIRDISMVEIINYAMARRIEQALPCSDREQCAHH
jgi:hypothetical protein